MRIGLDARLVRPGLGISRVVSSLAAGLASAGVEIVWFGEPGLQPEAVAEVVAPPPGFAGLDSPLGHRAVASQKLDLMHFPGNSGWWCRGPVPHVLTVQDLIWRHGLRAAGARQMLGHAYLRFAVPRAVRTAARVAVPSQITADQLRDGFAASSVVIPYGVDGQWHRPRPRLAEKPYLVAFSARDERKGTEISLAAWRRVAGRGVGLTLLAGAGVPSRLEAELHELRSRGEIELFSYLSEDTLIEIVAGATALLYPSREEGFGLPVAEAMAAGVPVITGLAPVTLEVGGDAVLALDPQDPAGSAARHVERLLDEPSLAEQLGTQGREKASELTWPACVARYLALYREVLST